VSRRCALQIYILLTFLLTYKSYVGAFEEISFEHTLELMVGERRCSGEEFHLLGAATRKLRLPNSVLVDGTHRSPHSLPRPLGSRLRPDVRDRQTDVRQHHRLMSPPIRGGAIIKS